MAELPTASDGSDPGESVPARAQRSSVMLVAVVEQLAGGAVTRHRVRDLSSGGMRIDNAACLQPDIVVLISIGGLQAIPATIRWIREGFAGIAFDEKINPDEARTKAAVTPNEPANPRRADDFDSRAGPTAGWMGEMRNAYKK